MNDWAPFLAACTAMLLTANIALAWAVTELTRELRKHTTQFSYRPRASHHATGRSLDFAKPTRRPVEDAAS